MADLELTREAKEAIRGYILKIVIPSGTALALLSFGMGFLINDVARKDAYSTAFTEANRVVLDTVGRVSKAESEAMSASTVLKEALKIAETIKASAVLSRTDEQIARIAAELGHNLEFISAVRADLRFIPPTDYGYGPSGGFASCEKPGEVVVGVGTGNNQNNRVKCARIELSR
jgi:hypothetical protein